MTRCFLAAAGVPNILWQETFSIAVYLAYRIPSTRLGGTRPFSMWNGETPPPLDRLRTFGARAFVHQKRYVKKLTMKAWEGRIVG